MDNLESLKLDLLQIKKSLQEKPYSECQEKSLLRINSEIEEINKQLKDSIIPEVIHNYCRSGKNVKINSTK